MKREVIVFILLISAFLAIGCTGQQPTAPTNETPATPFNSTTGGKVIEVSIQNFAFEPKSVKISVGDTVKWTNLDSVSHTIKSTDFTSEVLKNGGSFSHTFTQVGTYDYECSIHPSMKGVVIVE
ncbi:plastocyanin [Methanomethylovorans hollandica DSM 15978]|uniref:Plastocyanin n=1 Tax=Methanomethylovorans hollandica (strain DSM 15978 / NBRC 107637 / DMS1) TaxID=867904 RepID=L0KTQ9_METHD|nr:cupredoxin family copper-binding protein [Methanomethylovorans hollandica]AGB48787.1 plastocyanin [Methanomethylovorans hollandica DSM 15978]